MATFKLVNLACVTTFLLPAFACAEDHAAPPAVVTRYCSGCHGVNGRPGLPYIPKLAGLNSAYLEHKLTSFRGQVPSPVDEAIYSIVKGSGQGKSVFSADASVHMIGTANAISQRDISAAAEWYAAQTPAPGKQINTEYVDHGKSLYAAGEKASKVPACQSCHGWEAEGTPGAPRLAGQHATYILSQLNQFRSGKQDSPMTDVARSLSAEQAMAIAAYLQSR